MTTVHAYTATQKTVDGPSGKVCACVCACVCVCVCAKLVHACMYIYEHVYNYIVLLLTFSLSLRNGVMVVEHVRTSSLPPLEQPRQ